MPDIHIHRDHKLGLSKAREVAQAWALQVETKFDMSCKYLEGKGASGTLEVAADHFDLQARLGFLLGAFSTTIEAEIERHLDEQLRKGAKAVTPARKPARKVEGRK